MKQNEPLAKGRRFKNGNGFSTGHAEFLPDDRYMIDIDRMRLSAELTISKENSVFVEYAFKFEQIKFIAIFSLKHRQLALPPAKKSKSAFDFLGNISNRVLREMARQLDARLFLVLHDDDEQPPFDVHEVDVASGVVIHKVRIDGQKKEAWEKAWQELGLNQ